MELIASRRDSITATSQTNSTTTTLLSILDGITTTTANFTNSNNNNDRIATIAITVDPSDIDPALRRPGRLDVEVEIPIPSNEKRAEILDLQLREQIRLVTGGGDFHLSDAEMRELNRACKGFTGADCLLAIKVRSAEREDEEKSDNEGVVVL